MTKSLTCLSVLALTLSGCSTSYRSEPVESKMSRYAPKTREMNKVPEIPAIHHKLASLVTPTQTGRMPASVKTDTPALEISEALEEQLNTELANHSNKRLYFMTLYTQYEALTQIDFIKAAPTLNVCPHFHSQLVNYKERHLAQQNQLNIRKAYSADLLAQISKDESMLSLYPELGLPMTDKNLRPRVIDVVSKHKSSDVVAKTQEALNQALTIHVHKTHAELSELCEYGVSENYFIFENLAGHFQRHSSGPSINNLQVLLKTSVFYNHALIKAMNLEVKSTGRFPASAQSAQTLNAFEYGNEGLERLGSTWTKSYFDNL
jgi:hypothetical protein